MPKPEMDRRGERLVETDPVAPTGVEPPLDGADGGGADAALPVAPVLGTQRISSIDTLRGVAVLGILVMNIPWFALPSSSFFNPLTAGGFEGMDYLAWLISHLFFDWKMITIFSLLFGAGVVVFTQRAEERQGKSAALYYRRMGWMILFGLIHGYLIWAGDILYTYGMCGLWVYLFRRRAPWLLITIGVVLLAIGLSSNIAGGFFFEQARDVAKEAEAVIAAGGTPTPQQSAMLETWRGLNPGPEELAAEAAAFRGSWWDLTLHQAPWVFWFQTFMFLSLMVWRTGGLMLIGMALMKLGVFSAARSARAYAAMMIAGYLVGLPIVYAGAQDNIRHEFDLVHGFQFAMQFNYVGSLFVAAGHIGLVMLVCRLGLWRGATGALAAVGQMAFTNYLMHSLICSLIFNGYGLGWWNTLSRIETLGVVLGVWTLQLIVSPIWLRHFHFGPLEWLWRSLTYWQARPMRRAAAAAPGGGAA